MAAAVGGPNSDYSSRIILRHYFDFLKHEDTGIVINYDPRLEPEECERIGVFN